MLEQVLSNLVHEGLYPPVLQVLNTSNQLMELFACVCMGVFVCYCVEPDYCTNGELKERTYCIKDTKR